MSMTSDVPPAHQHASTGERSPAPTATLDDHEAELRALYSKLRALYRERAHLVAALATHPDVRSALLATDPAGEPGRTTLAVLDSIEGQMSWHLADVDLDLVGHVPQVDPADPDIRAVWDGHTSAMKYARLRKLTLQAATTHQHDSTTAHQEEPAN